MDKNLYYSINLAERRKFKEVTEQSSFLETPHIDCRTSTLLKALNLLNVCLWNTLNKWALSSLPSPCYPQLEVLSTQENRTPMQRCRFRVKSHPHSYFGKVRIFSKRENTQRNKAAFTLRTCRQMLTFCAWGR